MLVMLSFIDHLTCALAYNNKEQTNEVLKLKESVTIWTHSRRGNS